jgi:hypothetical protein
MPFSGVQPMRLNEVMQDHARKDTIKTTIRIRNRETQISLTEREACLLQSSTRTEQGIALSVDTGHTGFLVSLLKDRDIAH